MILLSYFLCQAGLAALALSQDRHYQRVTRREPVPPGWRYGLRAAGLLLLAGAAWACMRHWGVGVGLVAWFAWLTLGTVAAALVLQYVFRPAARE